MCHLGELGFHAFAQLSDCSRIIVALSLTCGFLQVNWTLNPSSYYSKCPLELHPYETVLSFKGVYLFLVRYPFQLAPTL